MKILILAEHDNQNLKSVNFHTLTAAQQMSGTIDVLIAGHECSSVIKAAKTLPNVRTLLVAQAKEYEHQLAENLSLLLARQGKKYDAILTGATTYGKNILPRAAALLDTPMLSDVINIAGPDTFIRPIYAGNALATVVNKEKIKILTLRMSAFSAAKPVEDNQATIDYLADIVPNKLSIFIKQELTHSMRPELTDARIVVSGGRGLKSKENFKMLEALADSIGAAVGASRAAVDAGFVPNDYQVGQTGKIVAPDVYIAVGISGAVQHLAGMKESKIIVAINSDPDAPIFHSSDYILVGDLFQLLPELQQCLKEAKCD